MGVRRIKSVGNLFIVVGYLLVALGIILIIPNVWLWSVLLFIGAQLMFAGATICWGKFFYAFGSIKNTSKENTPSIVETLIEESSWEIDSS